jgi:hypothetical protein
MQSARFALIAAILLAAGGCAAPAGDFGRPRANVFNDNIMPMIGDNAAWVRGEPVSAAPFTDDERQLRDLAYAILMPPDDRQAWERKLAEWRRTRFWPEERTNPNIADYSDLLLRTSYRSSTARYSKLIDDIRADNTRPGPFFTIAARVAEMDGVREKAIASMWHLSPTERDHASIRIEENRMLVGWVQRRFGERLTGYQLALERMVLATPAPAAIEAERALAVLAARIGEYQATPVKVASGPPPRPVPTITIEK